MDNHCSCAICENPQPNPVCQAASRRASTHSLRSADPLVSVPSAGEAVDDSIQVWRRPEVVEWSQWLLDSYRHCLGRELIERVGGDESQAQALFTVPMVVVSHGTQADPILNYGSQLALTLWEMTWEQLVQTPSRLTAELVNREERERMLERARAKGYLDDYRGV